MQPWCCTSTAQQYLKHQVCYQICFVHMSKTQHYVDCNEENNSIPARLNRERLIFMEEKQ